MANHIIRHYLSLTQEQIKAFVKFKEAGYEFFRKFSSLNKFLRWGWAGYELIIISDDYTTSSIKEYNFALNEKQVKSLRDMLELADNLKNEYSDQSLQFYSAEAEQLYNKMFVALAIFRDAVENMLKNE